MRDCRARQTVSTSPAAQLELALRCSPVTRCSRTVSGLSARWRMNPTWLAVRGGPVFRPIVLISWHKFIEEGSSICQFSSRKRPRCHSQYCVLNGTVDIEIPDSEATALPRSASGECSYVFRGCQSGSKSCEMNQYEESYVSLFESSTKRSPKCSQPCLPNE